jgi:hypothetical protein
MAATSEPFNRGSTFITARWIFLRLLGVVFLIAFVSFGVQAAGLIGSGGILPADNYLDAVRERFGWGAYWRLPTLLWLGAGDAAIHGVWIAGAVLSVILTIGVLDRAVLFLLWAAYLSLIVAGQTFFNFQWDVLLLETAFTSLWLAPLELRPGLHPAAPPSRGAVWLLRWLLFKLMFLSGATKLLSLDESWWGFTALPVHYESQPLPTWIGWHVFQLPAWFHQTSLWAMFAIELAVPCLIFCPRRLRRLSGLALIFLQLTIALTGNYNFFNLLSAALCVPLFDDRFFTSLSARFRPRAAVRLRRLARSRPPPSRWARIRGAVAALLAGAFLVLSALSFIEEIARTERGSRARGGPRRLPELISGLCDGCERYLLTPARGWFLEPIAPWRTINGYGLFRVMTTERNEIAVEGSLDGREWKEYEFRWKPGRLDRAPAFVAPHQPRLDWQMWFAALHPQGHFHWLEPLFLSLLKGEAGVLALLGPDPFAGARPRYVRLRLYRYHFTDREERRTAGRWWRREDRGPLTRPLSLPERR